MKRTLSSVIQETLTKHYRLRWKEVSCDPERNLLVGQCSAEMLLDVGLQHCVEVLKLSVSDQTYDVYLADGREKQRQLQCLHSSRHLQGRWELMSTHLIVSHTKMSDSIHIQSVKKSAASVDKAHTHGVTSIRWVNTQTLHPPMRQTRGCRSRRFGSVPSWCWTRHPECPAETTHTHTHTYIQRRCPMRMCASVYT